MEHPDDHSVQLLARHAIPAGTQLTTSYVQTTQPTKARRQQLYNTWNFWCCCDKCSDPTEGGANLTGIDILLLVAISPCHPQVWSAAPPVLVLSYLSHPWMLPQTGSVPPVGRPWHVSRLRSCYTQLSG